MNLDEVRKSHAMLWVACHVLKRDENGQPTDVEVVATAPDRIRIREKVLQEDDVCIFYAGDIPTAGFMMLL
jgi:hypothetical protein